MPKERTITVYLFEELDKNAKETAREWWRMGMHEDWSDSVIEDATEIAKMFGIDDVKFMWSGFSSQGDGACFDGTWIAQKCTPDKVKEHAPVDQELHKIADEFATFIKQYPLASFVSKRRGSSYYHDRMPDIDVDLDDGAEDIKPISPEECGRAEKEISETARRFMRWVYKQLNAEYDYLNSDECVDEQLIDNGYEFFKNGKRA